MVLFLADKADNNSVSFHVWDGKHDIAMPLSVCDDLDLDRPFQPSKLQQAFAALAYYLLAFFNVFWHL
jgi:hypothetical protein